MFNCGRDIEKERRRLLTADEPVLVYWNVNGRSSMAQAILVAGDISYQLDDGTANQWPSSKGDCPFGQLPILQHGGNVFAQSGSIIRYCARLAGLYPNDIVAASVCDMYIDEVMDIFSGLFKAKNAADKEAKLAAWKELRDDFLPNHFGCLEKLLSKSGKPFLGGDKANCADVALFAVLCIYNQAGMGADELLARFPKVKGAIEGSMKLGGLKSFDPNGGICFSADPENQAF
jgi:glutathione S-transferase